MLYYNMNKHDNMLSEIIIKLNNIEIFLKKIHDDKKKNMIADANKISIIENKQDDFLEIKNDTLTNTELKIDIKKSKKKINK